jgi:anaphase-promoting complex subunit 2
MEEFCKDLPADENSSNLASNSEIDKDWRTWLPDPIDANPVTFTQENSKPDIISMLVNIYGSKDMFVNEYKTLLGDRLLSSYSYTMEKEIRYLELLKLRFGDSNLFCCEAMLRDISESKRINANVLEQLFQKGKLDKSQITLKCIILSEQFWAKTKR